MAEKNENTAKNDGDGGKPAASPEEEASKSKKKKLILLGGGGLLVVVAIGVGAAIFLSKPSDQSSPPPADPQDVQLAEEQLEDSETAGNEAAQPQTTATESGADSGSTVSDFGETYQMKTFNLNLGNPLENTYIRLEVALEYRGGEKQKEEIERRLPQLRDAVIGVVGRKSREFLLGPDGRAQLRRELQIRINRYMTQPIESVYITDMLIE